MKEDFNNEVQYPSAFLTVYYLDEEGFNFWAWCYGATQINPFWR